MHARVTLTKAQRAALIDCLNTEYESADCLADVLVNGFLQVVADRVRACVIHTPATTDQDSTVTVSMGWSSKTDAAATAKKLHATGQLVETAAVKWVTEED